MASPDYSILLASSNGTAAAVVDNTLPGTLLYTVPNETDVFYEVWMWTHNTSTQSADLQIYVGGTEVSNRNYLPDVGLQPVIPGIRYKDTEIRGVSRITGAHQITLNINKIDQSNI